MSLGQGNNKLKLGKIAGFLRVLTLVDEECECGLVVGYPALLIFTDSLLVVGALEWGCASTNMPSAIRELLQAYRA
jgi:hypothetical protein